MVYWFGKRAVILFPGTEFENSVGLLMLKTAIPGMPGHSKVQPFCRTVNFVEQC